MDMGNVEGDFIMEHVEGLCAICKDDILDNSPTVKVIVHLSCIKPVYPAGPFPGKIVPLDQIENDIREAKESIEETKEVIEKMEKKPFKPNAWHKPPND